MIFQLAVSFTGGYVFPETCTLFGTKTSNLHETLLTDPFAPNPPLAARVSFPKKREVEVALVGDVGRP